MEVDVATEIVIDRPRAVVADYAADPDNATAWYKNIKYVEWRSPKPVTVGSQIGFQAQFVGRSLAYTYEIVEFIPGERLVMQTTDGPFAMTTTYRWADEPDGGTRMQLRNQGRPSGFFTFVAPILATSMRRANRADLRRLKTILEQPSH